VLKNRRHPDWRKKPPVNAYKVLSILLIIIFAWFLPSFIKKLIIIKDLVCQSQYGDCPSEIVESISYIKGSDYRFAKKILQEKLGNNFVISDYLIQYQIPSTVKIDLVVKKPVYAVKGQESVYLVDSTGLILSQTSETDLLTVNYPLYNAEVGKSVDSKLYFILQLAGKTDKITDIENATIQENRLDIKIINSTLVIFPADGEVDTLVGAFRLIYSRLNSGDEGFRMEDVKEIDLRFENPIVRKK
jgi:hypothetical protein